MTKKNSEPKNQTTITSAPLKGANQDQSGVGVNRDYVDYTISDEAILGINPGVHMHPQVQMRAGARGHTRNAPGTAGELQSAANLRRIRLSRHTESERMDQKKQKEQEIRRRKMSHNMVKEANLKASLREDDDDDDWEPSKGAPTPKQYNKLSASDQFGARLQHDMKHGLLPKGGAAVGDDEVDDMHKREYDSKTASGHSHLINPKNPYLTPGYTGPKDSYGKSKADWDKEAGERRSFIDKHGMDAFNKHYGYPAGSPRYSKVDDKTDELERKINTHNMLKANGMKSPYENDSAVKESTTLSVIKKVVSETRDLKGNQKKLDKNHNGRLDKEDFKILRKEEVEQIDEISSKLARKAEGKSITKMNKAIDKGDYETELKRRAQNDYFSSYAAKKEKAAKAAKMKEEVELEEARRGRPKKNATDEDPGSEHIMMQMRKVISTRGMHPVQFNDGKKHQMNPSTAHRVLSHHDNLKTSQEKQDFAARVHRSKDSMHDALSGKPEEKKPKISLAGNYKK